MALKKKKKGRLIYSRIVLILLVAAIFFAGRAVWGVFEKEQMTRDNLAAVEEEYGELQERKERLERELADLETKRGVEREIRERFRVAKEGEEVVILVDAQSDADDEDEEDSGGIWQKILDIFR